MSPTELKRRMTWLWRLSCSRLSKHIINDGCVSALWVFDTVNQPDGGVLQAYMKMVAHREGLRLKSFGPGNALFSERLQHIAEFISRLGCLLHQDFDIKFAHQVKEKISEVFADAAPAVLLVGSSKGTFATVASGVDLNVKVWEVQHGLLDQSYFPMSIQRFYSRSHVSAAIVEEFAPHVDVEILSHSLDPPEGYMSVANLNDVCELMCFSKNPGGGCNSHDLALFELGCYLAAQQLQIKFSLQLHPRDNVLKLLWRHRRLYVLGWLRKPDSQFGAQRRLVVSAYSSALITESRRDDLLINVMIEKPNEITRREYHWLPTVSLAELGTISSTSYAFIRTH